MQLEKPLRVRTLTAGIGLLDPSDPKPVEQAIDALLRGRARLEAEGYEVQTLRIATQPWLAMQPREQRTQTLDLLVRLDQLIADHGVILSVGPVQRDDARDDELGDWSAQLIRLTQRISFSCVIASATRAVHSASAITAAQIMRSLSSAVPHGMGNFRFAAAANIPSGTPFFPVAWHEGEVSFALGIESASVVEQAFTSSSRAEGESNLRALLNASLKPLERIGEEFAIEHGYRWLGIDTSPAPAKDRSIGEAIEAFTGQPFGSAGTLEACATITAALKSLEVKTCGYSGLMLPVLEDECLARRAGEGRFTIRDLLLYSSVCGTGLDVVPIPGDTPVEVIAALLSDVAALSSRLKKPLSARLFLVPNQKAGEIARFNDSLLTDCAILPVN